MRRKTYFARNPFAETVNTLSAVRSVLLFKDGVAVPKFDDVTIQIFTIMLHPFCWTYAPRGHVCLNNILGLCDRLVVQSSDNIDHDYDSVRTRCGL